MKVAKFPIVKTAHFYFCFSHIVTKEDVRVVPDNINKIKSPNNVKHLRSKLGLFNCC